MKRLKRYRMSGLAPLAAGLVLLAGCGTGAERINIVHYAPVIDVKGQGYDLATYHNDLDECRVLGMKVQMAYEDQRRREQEAQAQAAIVGALVGAAVGHGLAQHNDNHAGRGATVGALAGAAVGSDTSPVDYSHTMAKFGPTAVVDRCMSDRGYRILSAEGYGGG